MREFPAILFLTCHIVVIASTANAEALDEPYRVWVSADGASVFSGPKDDYYATQQLAPGTECEVHAELRDGWLAIRPPAGSYSLVLKSAIGPIEDGVAHITRDNTPSRLGSVLSDKYSAVHVRLNANELVQVIDDGTADRSQWITIAPPAGEFRWIRAADVVTSLSNIRTPDIVESTAVVTVEPIDLSSEEPQSSTWRERPDDLQDVVSQGSKNDAEVVPVAHSQADNQSTVPPPAASSRDEPATAPAAETNTSFARQLDRLEIQLSRRIAGPVNLWVFDDLERSAAQLLSLASALREEQAVRDVASRLSRFSALGERYRTAKTSADTTINDIASNDRSASGSNSLAANVPAASQYDAVGVLRPVVSKQGNAPPYALVDDAGKVVTFVTPSPSLNLQQHLGKRVGVSGTRGFLPAFRNRNIQTARVAPLDATTLR